MIIDNIDYVAIIERLQRENETLKDLVRTLKMENTILSFEQAEQNINARKSVKVF